MIGFGLCESDCWRFENAACSTDRNRNWKGNTRLKVSNRDSKLVNTLRLLLKVQPPQNFSQKVQNVLRNVRPSVWALRPMGVMHRRKIKFSHLFPPVYRHINFVNPKEVRQKSLKKEANLQYGPEKGTILPATVEPTVVNYKPITSGTVVKTSADIPNDATVFGKTFS